MKLITGISLSWLLTLMTTVGPAAAATADEVPPDHAAVLATIDATFQAMARHDAPAMRTLLVPGARFAVRRPDGSVTLEADSDFLKALAEGKGEWRERIWSPSVMVHGGLAQVWAPYDFHLDGKLSHCGIDSFSLVEEGGHWRIAGIAYDVQITDCPSPPAKATPTRR